MIFVVSKYENWSRYWFNEFAVRSAVKDVKERTRTIKLNNGERVQFVGEKIFEDNISPTLTPQDNVIYWGEGDENLEHLEEAITNASDYIIPDNIKAYTYTLCKEK